MNPKAREIALHVITKYDQRHRLPTSALALMFEALDDAEQNGFTEASIHAAFNQPLAGQIVRAIQKGKLS